jgi:hypothetical protein
MDEINVIKFKPLINKDGVKGCAYSLQQGQEQGRTIKTDDKNL